MGGGEYPIILLQKSSAREGFCAEKSLAINRSSPVDEIRTKERPKNAEIEND